MANFDHQDLGNGDYVTFLEMLANVLQEAADNEDEKEAKKAVKAVAEAFRDVADVTLATPTVDRSEAGRLDTSYSRSETWVPPLPWWFGNAGMFKCQIVNVTNVRCVRRPDDRPDDWLPSTGQQLNPGRE